MLISTKGRYALRVMVDLAEHSTDGFITLFGLPLKVRAMKLAEVKNNQNQN